MGISNEKFNLANSPEYSDESISLNQIEQRISNIIYNSKDESQSLPTEVQISEPIPIPQQISQNSNEEISNNSAENAGLISQNNNTNIETLNPIVKNNKNETTKEKTYKKPGRREKDSTLTGGHTKNFPGNILRKNGTAFMDSMYTSLNNRCKMYNVKGLKRINFKIQFGYNEDNETLVKQKLYKILRYENKHNQKVIKQMTEEKKDKVFIYLISCSFEYLYGNYIEEKNKIYFDEKNIYSKCFETLSEIAIKQEISQKFDEDWTKEMFVKSSKQFLKEVYGEGNLNYRERRMPNKLPCEYEEVKEIENFFENLKPYIY